MGMYEEYQEARRKEASGVKEGGTRFTELGFLMEQMIIAQREMNHLLYDFLTGGPRESEDPDGADPV